MPDDPASTLSDPYAPIAAWYDLEHDTLTADVECFAEMIGEAAGGRASVLEIGGGTGRIAAGLAVAGHEVTAVEPSAAMRTLAAKRLAALPERVARRIHLAAGTADAPGLGAAARFDAAIFGLDTFAHLTALDERLRALAAVRALLRPGGLLLLDLDPTGLRRLAESAGHLWHQGTWPLPASGGGGGYVSHFVAAAPGREPGLVTLTHFYDVHEQGGALTRTVGALSLAQLSHGEVELTLAHAGYRVEAVYGGYDRQPYEEGAARALFAARPA